MKTPYIKALLLLTFGLYLVGCSNTTFYHKYLANPHEWRR